MADLASTLEVVAAATLMAAVVGLGITAFVWVRNWRRRLAEAATIDEQIASYQDMLDDGLIDPEEFERIQARLRQPPVVPAERPGPEPPPNPPPSV